MFLYIKIKNCINIYSGGGGIFQNSYCPLSSAATASRGSYVVNKRLSSNLIWGKGHSEYF